MRYEGVKVVVVSYVELRIPLGSLGNGALVLLATGSRGGALAASVDARGAKRTGCAESGATDD